MIRVSQKWALLIDITNACHLHCSNCTRLLDHAKQRYFMSPACFEQAMIALKDFPTKSEPCPRGCRKIVGMIGGEPLLHPELPTLIDIMIEQLPQAYYRGFWTSKDWRNGSHPKWGAYQPQVLRLCGGEPTINVGGPSEQYTTGFINWNMHHDSMQVQHQPMLVASQDVVPDERARWQLINDCWVEVMWSSTVTPKGFFFCEVAGHFDMVFNGPGGLPLEPGVWDGELKLEPDERGVLQPVGKFAEQIKRWCPRCGACVPLPGRRDNENRDDVSASNLQELIQIQSPRVRRNEIVVHDSVAAAPSDWDPVHYRKGAYPGDQSQLKK